MGLSAATLNRLTATDEDLMPDTCNIVEADFTLDSLNKKHLTGTFTTTATSPCRWRELTGRDLQLVAAGPAADATHRVAVPKGVTAHQGQQIEIFQGGYKVLTARIMWVVTGTYSTSTKLYCKEVTV